MTVRKRPGGVLELRGVTGGYGGTTVVRDLDLTVGSGEALAVLGASGSGKTTVLRMIAGLHPVSAGRILVDGRRVDPLPAQHRGIGLVPQQGALFPHLSVARNVGFGLVPVDPVARWRSRAERAARVREVLELVGLADRADERPSRLSGGQQQRVALARALAPGSGLILLDEPFSALDAALRGRVRAEVSTLLAESGATSVLVTHDRAEALATADRVAVLIDGRLAQVDTPERLYYHPVSREVAQLAGEVVLLPATADGGVAHTTIGAVPLDTPARGSGTVLWRPESLTVRRVGQEGHGVCTGVEFVGASTLIRMCVDGTEQSFAVPVSGGEVFEVGARVEVTPLRPAVFHAGPSVPA
ncbi:MULTISPECIES: ABC transporter ATP-binding protein [Dietzia]|uniref:ABC transporter ATP-binding protein n=3 Tax=Dietzia TaxID=37914 RepID=A0ABP4UGM6_9ACTN|nr:MULTISPECIES: ABC transporter ATP-binding protein [Dietzia]MBC7295957.1 ABC transporter ATP-binding protein [Dietzia sp.]MBB1034251.1 ABC transporter ATP-binding protein [Dietzia sp. CQ4]MBB1039299.1 ABC transporter ATP-binding protein [Dietzia natronolimnaea]MBB1041387.1 ABC transporter ATP-binding protein [Dietzia sp. Cai40]MBB1047159.1 ABC transporter ATP-binding protein [Dietzia cercidiphylli]